MQKTKIVWPWNPLYTWNPVTGCKRGCSYCYARKIHERFNKTPFSDIVLHNDRLDDPIKFKQPKNIFVGSMTDIEYWPKPHIVSVMVTVELCPQHTFLFLSKSSVIDPWRKLFPSNCIMGLTLQGTETGHCQTERIDDMCLRDRFFLSMEPLIGTLKTKIPMSCEWVIVGAMSGPGAVKPRPEWVQSIRDNVPAEKIFWKPTMEPYL